MRYFYLFFLFFIPCISAELITITPYMDPVDAYTAIESAVAGDVVEIAPGTYRFRLMLTNHGTAEDPIIIRAKDPYDRPVWDLSGKSCEQFPGSYNAGDAGRGAWQIRGSFYEISDIIIRGSHILGSLAGESSGIRPSHDAANITVRNCLIEENDNGIVGNADGILYEFCEIRNNGVDRTQYPDADGTHNVYNHGGEITIRYSYIHDPKDGQNLHMRAKKALIEYNLIENAASYMGGIMTDHLDRDEESSIEQEMILVGNIIVQKDVPKNDGQMFVMYDDQGYENTRMRIEMYHNTIIGFGGSYSHLIHITDSGLEYQEAKVYNNIIYNFARPCRIDISSDFDMVLRNNWWSQSTDTTGCSQHMAGSVFGTDPGFGDIEKGDYSLTSSAQARNKASESGIDPVDEYFFNATMQMKYRKRETAHDLGAFEYGTKTPIVGYVPKKDLCPKLPSPAGPTITVGTESELKAAIAGADSGTTIMIEDGIYHVNNLQVSTPDIAIRSQTGNRDAVILDGEYQSGTSILTLRADNITVADITIKRAFYHGIHVQPGANHAKIYNVRFIDEREQFMKINPDDHGGIYTEDETVDFGEVACSSFELTDEGRPMIYNYGGGCYTGGIDAHRTDGWIIRDNVFKDIYCTDRGTSALAEHAIHFWRTNKDCIVERNTIINCARGIGFGMSNSSGPGRIYPDFSLDGFEGTVDHIRGIIRNNMILGDTPGVPGFDSGIALWNSYGTKVYHNTVISTTDQGSTIETRYHNSKDYVIQDNLLWNAPWERSGNLGLIKNNVVNADQSIFVNAPAGDLHILSDAGAVIGKAKSSDVIVDIDGDYRNMPDIGADEFSGLSAYCSYEEEICGNGIDEDCDGHDESCCGIADQNNDGTLSNYELMQGFTGWISGIVKADELIRLIDGWKNGC